jgi:hypothetical protein
MKKLILLVSFLISSNAFGFELEKTVQKDVTYDGKPEKVVYKVWGKSWDSPNWSFVIYDGDKAIFQTASTADYWRITEERGDWQGCTVIADCKKKTFDPGSFVNRCFDEINITEDRYDFMLENFATNAPEWYHQQLGVTEIKGKEYTKRLYDFLKGKKIIGLASPGNWEGLSIYDKFLKTFITFYIP